MVKRRDVIRLLEQNGFYNESGANHDRYTDGTRSTVVPRHREIDKYTMKDIMKQTGLQWPKGY